jgi:predicted PolB exonuclease-like 3'-5' exonuclease
MTTLVVFDIEAVPDLEVGRRLLGQPEDASDAEIRRLLGERYSRDGQNPATTFLKTPVYRIVSIAALYAKRDDGGGPWTVTQFGSRSVAEKSEAEILLGFVKSLPVDGRGTGPMLVTFGGNGFDLPLLRYRSFALGVPLPGLYSGGNRNYWHRFGQDHIDLCDVLSTYGASTKPSLAEMAALASIPVKIGGVDGSQVEAFVAGGRLGEVAGYCLTDVIATYCVFLRYAMVRGDLRQPHFESSMENLYASLRKHIEQWPILSAFIEHSDQSLS